MIALLRGQLLLGKMLKKMPRKMGRENARRK